MAGDWFPVQLWRSKCPEVVRISSATARSRHEVLGLLCDLWSWLSTETEDGVIPGVFTRDLVGLVGADAAFWEAVQAVGWLSENESGIVVPSWENWLSESAKKRAKDARRKRDERDGKRPNSVRKTSAKCPRSVRKMSAKNRTTEQDRTEEKKEEIPPLPPTGGGKKPRQRNEVFDAIADVCGADPTTAGKLVGSVAAALRQADPPYTADDVREFGRRFWELCPWAATDRRERPTPRELQNHIGKVRAAPLNRAPPQPTRSMFETQDERVLYQIHDAINGEP